MMNELTLIVTFLNEGAEVYKTIESFKNSTNVPFDIILINDGSTDGYDYREIADCFDAEYVEHAVRKGTASSRNEGVSLCSTKYFLLIDAHMRVYQEDWISRIVHELDKEENLLLCCSTLSLDQNGRVCNNVVGYGAFIDLPILDAKWNHLEKEGEESFEIPCVLGASYAGHKRYWLYLKGLNGLESYGFEEQLISLKVWLSGGKCKVLKDVKFGHIFREEGKTPYTVSLSNYYLNQLMIVELFYNEEYKRIFLRELRKKIDKEQVNAWVEEFGKCRQKLMEEKGYYNGIFCRDFDFIMQLNDKTKYIQE